MTDQPEHGCTINGQPAMPIPVAEYNQLITDLAALRAVARGYCPECGRGDAGPTAEDWERQRRRADQVEELLRIAHDTSNKSEAERARAVQRAERAETALREVLALFGQVTVCGRTAFYQATDHPIHPDDMHRWRAALAEPGPA